MAGMNVLGSPEISDYQGRTVTIEVTGVCQQSVLKTGSYQVRVPFSQMSQAMQTITRQGGKVAAVHLGGQPAATSGSSSPNEAAPAPESDESGEEQKTSKRKRR